MKVYVTGLIYFNGCNEEAQRMWAPIGTGHHASLWIDASQVDTNGTNWWPGSKHRILDNDADVIEFVIQAPSTLSFPDGGGGVSCSGLDEGLSKFKRKKPGEPDEEFEANPDTAQTNAEVTIGGGVVGPLRLNRMGLVRWTLPNQDLPLVITAVLKDGSGSKTIALNTNQAEIVFANTHELPDDDLEEDTLAGSHVAHFINLNPETNAFVALDRPSGNVARLRNKDAPAALQFMRNINFTCGDTPGCCRTHGHH